MAIIIHYPVSEEALLALSNKVARVHAQAVVENLRAKACPSEQKLKFVEEMKRLHTKSVGHLDTRQRTEEV